MKEKETTKDPGGGLFFHRYGLYLLVGMLVAGGWFGMENLVFLAGTILALSGLARGWSRLSLWRVSYGRTLKTTRAFPGEDVEMVTVLENKKFLPVFWIETTETFPPAIAPEDLVSDDFRLTASASLLWYHRQVRRLKLPCRRRGYFPLSPANVTSGDIFGLFPRTMSVDDAEAVIVYPRLFDIDDPKLPSSEPMGDLQDISRLFPDPTRIMGPRDYTPDTPFRHIHWKATARKERLQAKAFEPFVTLRVYLYLNVDGFEDGDEFESAVSLAASLANRLITDDLPVGCFVNSAPADAPDGETAVFPGSGLDQTALILETLAKVTASSSRPFGEFFDEYIRAAAMGATICIVTQAIDEDMNAKLADLGRFGFRVMIYHYRDPETESAAGISRRADDVLIGGRTVGGIS